MKIPKENQAIFITLLEESCHRYGILTLKEFKRQFLEGVDKGTIKVLKCEAVNCFSRLLKGEALEYLCAEIYCELKCNDTHLHTFFRNLYKSL